MMRQPEFKMKYDPEIERYTKQHIHGEGISDVFKSIGKSSYNRSKQALTTAATKTGEHVGNKTEDKIVKMLSKNSESKNVPKKNKNKVLFMTI